MSNILKTLPVKIRGIYELENIDHNIDESGKEPLENARIKALHYFQQIRAPVFSIDSGLFFDDVEYEDQPGTHIRRVNGAALTDNEMIKHYANLADKYGGKITAYYKNAICIIINEKNIIENDSNTINSEKFIITSKPHQKIVAGWPLNSLSKEIKSGEYYHDLNREMNDNAAEEFKKIFTGAIEKITCQN